MGRRVVIVGGGPTAVSAFVHLTDVAGAAGVESVRFVAPNPIGCAPAFGSDDPGLVCNTSLDVTSLRAEGDSDLLRYLAARGWPVDRADFVPRALVTQYTRERYLRHREAAERCGIEVLHTADRALALRGTPGDYRVCLAGSGTVRATDVLLCQGGDAPRLPAELREHADAPRLLSSPYPSGRLRRIPAGDSVLVLGTKLSAIDAALVLCDSGHRTVMTSPSGELPAVRTRLCRGAESGLAGEWAEVLRRGGGEAALVRPLLARIRAAGGGRAVRRGLCGGDGRGTVPDRLRRELELAEADSAPWQDSVSEVIDALNEVLPQHSEQVRDRVTAAHHRVMSRYISAIPAENARRLLQHLQAEQLAVAPEYPYHLRPNSRGWTVSWPDGRSEHVDWVVAATGVHAPLLHVDDTGGLVFSDRTDRANGADPVPGHPARIERDLRVVRTPGGPPERVWALGNLAGSRFPIVNYLRAAAQHAHTVSRSLAGEHHCEPAARSACGTTAVPAPVATTPNLRIPEGAPA